MGVFFIILLGIELVLIQFQINSIKNDIDTHTDALIELYQDKILFPDSIYGHEVEGFEIVSESPASNYRDDSSPK